jgi:putative hydrolase of the HAD superfamily
LKAHYPQLENDVDVLVRAFRAQLLVHLPPLEAEAAGLLAALDDARVPWGIVTNGSCLSQRGKVRTLELERRAGCVLISEELGIRKPDPVIFHAAAASLGLAPADVLYVGDHPEADVIGAAQAGMQTAWLRRGRDWPTHLTPAVPDIIVDSLSELLWIAEGRRES